MFHLSRLTFHWNPECFCLGRAASDVSSLHDRRHCSPGTCLLTLIQTYLPYLFTRNRDFVLIEGRRQYRYPKELICCLRVNSIFPILEHLEPLAHSDPHSLDITPYRRFFHEY